MSWYHFQSFSARCQISLIGAQSLISNYVALRMPIDAINITRYPRDRGPYTIETIERPTWDIVEREIRSMHNWEKPILWLKQDREIDETNCMAITGGSGIYHLQIVDEKGNWRQAADPEGSDHEVEVWLSDQGFATEAKFTWPVEKAVKLARWYYDRGTPHPEYSWV